MKQGMMTNNFPPEAVAAIAKLQQSNAALQEKVLMFQEENTTLQEENKRFQEEVLMFEEESAIFKEEVVKFQEENAALQEENTKLAQELLYYKRLCYGRRSERRMPHDPEGQMFIPFEGKEEALPEELADVRPVVEEIQEEARKRKTKKEASKNRPIREAIPAHIERRTRILEPRNFNPDEMERIGEDIREILHYTPGSFYVDRIVRPIYKAKTVDAKSMSTPIYQADAVETFIPKSYAGNSVLIQIILSKYIDHLPVFRQVEIFKREGIKLPLSTVNGWIHQVASQLYPLYEAWVKEVLKSEYIQVDESTAPVIDNEKKRAVKEYFWVVRDMATEMSFFYYDDGSRSQRTAYSLLKDYRGTMQCDGYEAYSIFENKNGVLLLACWAHVRRKFEAALAEDKRLANEALEYIGLLYTIEANLKDKNLSFDQIAAERKRLAYPLLKGFEKWMNDIYPTLLPKSLMGKAITYTFSLYVRLVRYVVDGRYHIDNNAVENTIRPLALGRKNYLFCGNDEAAKDTALFYSFLGSCKDIDVNPAQWLADVLDNIKDCKVSELHQFFPYNWKENRNKI